MLSLYPILPPLIYLSPNTDVLPNCEHIMQRLVIEIHPNCTPRSHSTIVLRDRYAKDLTACNHAFLELHLYSNHTAFLAELAAPSFSGRTALYLVWQCLRLSQVTHAFFADESTLLPCSASCTTEALTPLRSKYIYTHGQGWYERQGALLPTPADYRIFLDPMIEEYYVAAFEQPRAFGTSSPWNYERFRYYTSLRLSPPLTASTYSIAKRFLYNLSISQLEQALNSHPRGQQANKVLQKALNIAPDTKRIGPLLAKLEKLYRNSQSSKYHELLHAFQNLSLSHHHSFFGPLALEVLESSTNSTMLRAIGFYIVWSLPRLTTTNLAYACSSPATILFNLWTDRQNTIKPLRSLYSNYLTKFADAFLSEWAEHTPPAYTKIAAHSSHTQQILWAKNYANLGLSNYMDLFLPAVEWLGNLSLPDFDPTFLRYISYRFPYLLPEQRSLKEIIIHIREREGEEEALEFMESLHQMMHFPFARAAEQLLRDYQHTPNTISPRSLYLLWCLAKFIVDKTEMFMLDSKKGLLNAQN